MYHVLMQGAGNNELFHDDEDYQVFVEYLAKLMKEAWAEDDEPDRPYFHTYAYCLTPKEYRAPKPTETQVLSMVRLMTTATNWTEFNAFPKDERLKTIKQLLQNGASIRQMEKLTGIGRGTIQNL
jgi:hypothetical protein